MADTTVATLAWIILLAPGVASILIWLLMRVIALTSMCFSSQA